MTTTVVTAAAILAVVACSSTASSSPDSPTSGASVASVAAGTIPTANPLITTSATTSVAAASRDYHFRAVPSEANYYHNARSPSASVRSAATTRLANWFTGAARTKIIAQVKNWNPNYTVDINVSHAITVTGGYVNVNGTVTIYTVETWKVVTEGGPVLNANGASTTQEDRVHHTVHLQKFRFGWAVTLIT